MAKKTWEDLMISLFRRLLPDKIKPDAELRPFTKRKTDNEHS